MKGLVSKKTVAPFQWGSDHETWELAQRHSQWWRANAWNVNLYSFYGGNLTLINWLQIAPLTNLKTVVVHFQYNWIDEHPLKLGKVSDKH